MRGIWRLKKIWAQMNQIGLVLMYHRVTDVTFDPWQLCVKPKHFKEHLKIIKKLSTPVQFCQMGKNLGGFTLSKHKRIALTFDDGYADNFHYAKPLLEQEQVPATFFIVSGGINSKEEFWWDELERIILSSGSLPNEFNLNIAGTNYHWFITSQGPDVRINYGQISTNILPNQSKLTQFQLYYILWEILSHFLLPEKKSILRDLAQWSQNKGKPRLINLPMNSEELLSFSKSSLFEIGAHTVNHPMLSRLSYSEQKNEISISKTSIERIIGKNIISFSYPHGQYTEETVKILQDLKFKTACTVIAKPVVRNTSVYLLPRFNVLDWNGEQFEAELVKWLNFGY